mgnify:CR=1 FL=1
MRNVNCAVISGNVTRDAELTATRSGTAVLSFSVAVNDQRYDKETGSYNDEPSFIECVMYGKRGEALARFIQKGTFVVVSGRLRQSRWETEDGRRMSKVSIVADEINFKSSEPVGRPDVYDDDCPF